MSAKNNYIMMSSFDQHWGRPHLWWLLFFSFSRGCNVRVVVVFREFFFLSLLSKMLNSHFLWRCLLAHTHKVSLVPVFLFTRALTNFRSAWQGGREVGDWFSFMPVAVSSNVRDWPPTRLFVLAPVMMAALTFSSLESSTGPLIRHLLQLRRSAVWLFSTQ